jgi:pilus assembly protein CpaD
MYKFDRTFLRLLPLVAVTALAGCEAATPFNGDVYEPTSYTERYPIEVTKRPVKLDVSAAHGQLGPNQADTVARFAQSAIANRVSSIHIRRPSGGGKSIAVAQSIATILQRNGIGENVIVHSTYEGNAGSPVLVSYTRAIAVTKPCGDWSVDMTGDGTNQDYPNFGCATQNNIAAMVSNPRDFETPRSMSPSDPARRSLVFDKYRAGEPTVTAADERQQQIAISTVAQ